MQAEHRNWPAARHRHRATAIVEMAVVTPLLLTLVFGVIEFGWVFMVRQSLTNAAREGCRVAVLQNSTESQVLARVDSYMAGTGLTGYSVDYTPSNPPATVVETVRVSIPYADISLVGSFFGPIDFDLGSTCSMRKEGVASAGAGG
jgi:Flp pilus assembly protein TadG